MSGSYAPSWRFANQTAVLALLLCLTVVDALAMAHKGHHKKHHQKLNRETATLAVVQHSQEEDFTPSNGDGSKTANSPVPSSGGSGGVAADSDHGRDWLKDVEYYGTCLKNYRMLTLKENCGFAQGRPGGVTLQYAKCLYTEMALLNMAYQSGEARKQIIHHGVGADEDKTKASSQARHILQKCKAGVAYACASEASDSSALDSPQRKACRDSSISTTDLPASIGQDSKCPAKILKLEVRSDNEHMYAALESRVKDVAWAFREVPDGSFEGGSKLWGAAIAVCHGVSQTGVGGPYAGQSVLPDNAYITNGMYGQPPGPVPTSLEEEGKDEQPTVQVGMVQDKQDKQSQNQSSNVRVEPDDKPEKKYLTTWQNLIVFFMVTKEGKLTHLYTSQKNDGSKVLIDEQRGTWEAACIFLNLGFKSLQQESDSEEKVEVEVEVEKKCKEKFDDEWARTHTEIVRGGNQLINDKAGPKEKARYVIKTLLDPLERASYIENFQKTMMLLGGPTSVGKSRVTNKILQAAFNSFDPTKQKGKDVLFLDNDNLENLAQFEKTDLGEFNHADLKIEKRKKKESSRKWIKTFAMDTFITAEVGFAVSSRADGKNEADTKLSAVKENAWDVRLLLILASLEHLSCSAYKRWAEQIMTGAHTKPARPEDLKLTTTGIHDILESLNADPSDKVYVLFNEICNVDDIETAGTTTAKLKGMVNDLKWRDHAEDEHDDPTKDPPEMGKLVEALEELGKKNKEQVDLDMARHCFFLGLENYDRTKKKKRVEYSQHPVKEITMDNMKTYFKAGNVGEVAVAEKAENIRTVSVKFNTCSGDAVTKKQPLNKEPLKTTKNTEKHVKTHNKTNSKIWK